MTILRASYPVVVPRAPVPKAEIRFVLRRDGELSSGKRTLRLYRGWDTVAQCCMAFEDEGGGTGLATQVFTVPLASLLAQAEWVAVGVDDNPPRKTRAIYLAISAGGTYPFNITQGEGGAGGDPATVAAAVRVDRLPASREVLVVEKPTDGGQWRVAGYGTTVAGEVAVELKVVGGDCYAMAMDDFGLPFSAGLAVSVGQRIRPSAFSGWLYEITEAGDLPVVEPEWWPIEGDNASRALGTARAVAVRYYQPLAHGPIAIEVS